MKLNNYACLLITMIILAGCRKSTNAPTPSPVVDPVIVQPQMAYTDLSGKSIIMNQSLAIDLNKDGKVDVVFYTQMVADNLNNIVKQDFMANSMVSSYLNFSIDAATGEDVLPTVSKGKIIHQDLNDALWYNVSTAVGMRRVENNTSRAVSWKGNWTDKGHLYLPLQVVKDGGKYFGWIEFAADSQQEKLIFYQAAISMEADRPVRAGE